MSVNKTSVSNKPSHLELYGFLTSARQSGFFLICYNKLKKGCLNMKNLKSQSGRSMVEMLGVLAIIGVLSIGGIAGYTMAMNRYRANA